MKKLMLLAAAIFFAAGVNGQIRNDDVYEVTESYIENVRTEFRIPDVGIYKVLKCDFHTHTVFSDGNVWPNVRVIEAWKEGLDAIAITDHIEYRPHKNVLKGDLNESYKIAAKAANSYDLIVIQGTEITRSKPFGHINALFVSDANLIQNDDPYASIDEALRQGAFIQWNHPGWPDDKSTLYLAHEKLIADGKIHGVELVNYTEYYPLVFDWFGRFNLAPTANSDIHGVVALEYAERRPITLVLSESRSERGIKEALFARRTIAMYDNLLIGMAENLKSLILACIDVNFAPDGTAIITNKSDLNFKVTCNGALLIIDGGKSLRFAKVNDPDLTIRFENCFIGHNKNLEMKAIEFYR